MACASRSNRCWDAGKRICASCLLRQQHIRTEKHILICFKSAESGAIQTHLTTDRGRVAQADLIGMAPQGRRREPAKDQILKARQQAFPASVLARGRGLDGQAKRSNTARNERGVMWNAGWNRSRASWIACTRNSTYFAIL
jgi:hypothetical protein